MKKATRQSCRCAEITVPVAGKAVSVGMAGPGKVLGLRSIICGEVPEVDVTCLEKCDITLLSRDVFLEVLHRYPEMYFAVVKVLSADLKTVLAFLREKTSGRRLRERRLSAPATVTLI